MRLNRRQFIYSAGGAASAMLAGHLHGTSPPDQVAALPSVQQTARAFGTEVSITALHADLAIARQAIRAAFRELETVEEVMSIYRPDSQVCQLNRSGELANPHSYLVQVLRKAAFFSRFSRGAFDVTVQPLWDLYASAAQEGRLPATVDLQAARDHVDWRRVEVKDSRIRLTDDKTRVTLNGIAQGFAADRAIAALRRGGVDNAIVDAGELGGIGRPAERESWTTGIQHPRREDAFIALAGLTNRCLATSGDYATTFSEDRAYNHLFDPRTGESPTELASVSVVAPSAIEADALSTAICILGVDRGGRLVERVNNADIFAVTKNGRTLATAGFPVQPSSRHRSS